MSPERMIAGPGRTIRIGGEDISPWTRRTVDLPVAELYTRAPLTMPVHVVNGRRAGPVLFVCAAVHGDELNGVEIIRRVLRLKILRNLRGALLAVPIVNVHGFLDLSRYLPDRRDLNRSFPGSSKGSVAARLAHLFVSEIVRHADCGIDIHTGAIHRRNLPQIRANLEDEQTLSLAKAFEVPVIINADLRDGSLRQHAAELGIPTLLYEAGEALRFDEIAIRGGLKGVVHVMRELGMLRPSRRKGKPLEPVVARSRTWVRAPGSGILRAHAELGARVRKGEVLGVIGDAFGESESEVLATASGLVIGRSQLPLVHEGDALFHIARFDDTREAEDTVEEFRAGTDPVVEESAGDEPPVV
jgi:predicted deacylase